MSESNTRKVLGEQYYNQVSESIKSVFELTTRIDERVQLMMKKQEELDRKIEAQIGVSNILATRISILESTDSRKDLGLLQDGVEELEDIVNTLKLQLATVEGASNRQEDRWKGTLGFVVQLAWAIIVAYILYKLGLQSGP